MEKKLMFYGIIVVLVLAVLAVVYLAGQGEFSEPATSTIQGSTVAPGNASGTLFSSEPYYRASYLIAPGSVSQQSQSALDGYKMTVNQTAIGENVTISYSGRGVTTSLAAGDKLYIVETSFGDDAPGYEGSTADDGFVLVNASGYVVNTFGV